MEEESSKEEPTASCGSTTIWVRLMTCVGIFREGGKTLSTGAAPPDRRRVAGSAARRFGGRVARRHLKWSTPRLVLRRADACVACFYLPFDLSAVDPQSPRLLHVARSLAEFLILLG